MGGTYPLPGSVVNASYLLLASVSSFLCNVTKLKLSASVGIKKGKRKKKVRKKHCVHWIAPISMCCHLAVRLCLFRWKCSPLCCSHQFNILELAQTHVHQVSVTIQPSHPLSFPSPPALNLSQHQGLFQWVSSRNIYANPKMFLVVVFYTAWLIKSPSPGSVRDYILVKGLTYLVSCLYLSLQSYLPFHIFSSFL